MPFWPSLCCRVMVTCAFLFGFAGSGITAEWHSLYPYPTPNEIFDTYSPDGSTFYMVGAAGTILHYDGTNFTIMESPTKLPLYAIDGSGPTDIWAVGGDTGTESTADRAVILHFNGTSWTKKAAPASSGTTYPLSDVYVVNSTNAWAVMANQDRVARWNGVSWSFQTTLPSFSQGFNKVCGASTNAIWFVGDYNQMSFWDGSSFTDISRDTNFGYLDFTSCWAADSDTLYTGGNTGGLGRWDHLGSYETIPHNMGIKTVSGITGNSATDVYFLGYAGFFVHYDGDTATQLIDEDTWRRNSMVPMSGGEWIVGADKGIQQFDGSQVTDLSIASPLVTYDPFITFMQNGLWLVPSWVHSTSGIETFTAGIRSMIYSKDDATWMVKGGNSVGDDDVRLGVYSSSDSRDHIYSYSSGSWSEWIPPNGNHIMHDILRTQGGQLFAIFDGTSAGVPCRVEDTAQQCYLGSGNVFTALTACNETVYAVGEGGAIAVYKDGVWATEASGTTRNLVAAACSDNAVYAVGEARTAIWKTTGAWQGVSGLTTKESWNFTDVKLLSNSTFVASLKAPYGSQWMSFLYSFDSGISTVDLGWVGPNVKINAIEADGVTGYAIGSPQLIMYTGEEPQLINHILVSIKILRILAGMDSQSPPNSGLDVNNNGKVEISDAIYSLGKASE